MVGEHVGRYEILEELGRGGMGVVYKARDAVLSRTVALKALPTDRAHDPERRRRFLNEARSACALDHPNIVTVHDLLEHEGADWIVMEYVEGRTLDEAIPPEGLPVHQAVGWATEATDALHAAHSAGVIHRDVKPGNLMIDRAGRLRVLDFGLAKLDLLAALDPEDATRTAPLTLAGAVLGTLEYMSPEQAIGRTVDPRCDVFSLGAVLYQMLTGRRPFTGANAASKVHAVAFEHPPPPVELRPETPAEVSDLVLRALEKDPADRFQTMEEMGEALRGILRGSSGAPGRAEPGALRARWTAFAGNVRRRLAGLRPRSWSTTAAAALILALLLIGAVAVLAPGWGPALPGTPYAELRKASALLDAYWRDGHVDQAIDTLRRLVDENPDYAPAYAALARAYLHEYRSGQDGVWLERARAQADRALSLDPTLSGARVWLADAMLAQGRPEAAEKELEELLARDPRNADAHRLFGQILQARGETEAALERVREAISLDPEDPANLSMLGTLFFRAGRYVEAAEAFRRAIELADDNARSYSYLAASLQMQGRTGEAIGQLQRALEIRPDAVTYSNLGTLYFFQSLYPQALEAFERAIGLGANDHVIWNNLGDAYRWTPGREDDARRAYTRALQLLGEELEQAPQQHTLRSRRALLLAKRGTAEDRREAMDLARELLPSTDDPTALYRLALAYEIAGERDRALEALAAALANGYSVVEAREDPELTELRNDPRYHLIMVDHDSGG